ncbi:hypothetical protein GCM10023161_40870 [Mycobacterium paraffinicum]|uniref:ParB/Sulfiredoxin domain-containing protein n=1 Tax=Mycobacterium paraffinicum TaxID=53378 RepID=A0ABP8F233_9MYCO
MRVPLRGGMLLEVLEIPLDLPVLNADSFRIAPALAEHPQVDLVKADPNSPEAQHIVTELVRNAHRQADDLKESLVDGQDQPGVITRKGKLINANTRCVLLRELHAEGRITTSTIRVAVLPSDVTEPEELELESILQKQREHKDEYNLVSELMMLRKLHEGAGLSDAAIAKRLRTRAGRIGDLREVLDLMERARRLTDPPLPLSAFISERDQRQNWLELLGNVREIDARDGRPAGDLAIQRWLIAYILGFSSVHKLRHAAGEWIETEVLPDLADGDDIATIIASNAAIPTEPPARSDAEQPPGLDILGDEPAPPPDADAVAVQNLLNLSVAAMEAGDADLELTNGAVVPAADVKDVLIGSINRGLEARKRKSLAGSRLQRPLYGLTQARTGLREALEGIDEVGDRAEFQPLREDVLILVDEVRDLLEEVSDALQEAENDSGTDD